MGHTTNRPASLGTHTQEVALSLLESVFERALLYESISTNGLSSKAMDASWTTSRKLAAQYPHRNEESTVPLNPRKESLYNPATFIAA
jgi:hypothetical protein